MPLSLKTPPRRHCAPFHSPSSPHLLILSFSPSPALLSLPSHCCSSVGLAISFFASIGFARFFNPGFLNLSLDLSIQQDSLLSRVPYCGWPDEEQGSTMRWWIYLHDLLEKFWKKVCCQEAFGRSPLRLWFQLSLPSLWQIFQESKMHENSYL